MQHRLKQHIDGIEAVYLGQHGTFEYAVTESSARVTGTPGEVYRRPASHFGSYGGWRWEASVDHVLRYASQYPGVAEAVAVWDVSRCQ
jgi:hypothetical protein